MSDTLQLVVEVPDAQHNWNRSTDGFQWALSVGAVDYKLKRIGHSLSVFTVERFRAIVGIRQLTNFEDRL